MKKNLFVTALLLAGFTGYGFAQKDDAFLGVKLGMNIANCTNSDADARIGLNVGVMGQYFFTDHFAIEGDLLYSQQGCKAKEDGVKATVKLDYLTIPVLAKYYPTTGFNVYAGPQFGFAVNKKAKGSGYGVSVESDLEGVNTFDFGAVIGLGYDFNFGLLVDLRYNPGFTHIFKDVDSDDNSRNSVFTIGVGYKF